MALDFRLNRSKPKNNPFGAPESILHPSLEADFIASGMDAAGLNPHLRTNGHRAWIYFGDTSNPRDFYFYLNDERGEGDFTREVASFPNDMLLDIAQVRPEHQEDRYYFQSCITDINNDSTLELYYTEDRGENWTFVRSLSDSDNEIFGHVLFPYNGVVWQMFYTAASNRIFVYKDGVQEQAVQPTTALGFGSGLGPAFSLDYETGDGFIAYGPTASIGGNEIYFFDGNKQSNNLVQKQALPTYPVNTAGQIEDVIWLPKKGFLTFRSDNAFGPNHFLYISFDEGDTVESQQLAGRFTAPGFNRQARKGLFEVFGTPDNKIARSEGFYTEDLESDTPEWADILDDIGAGEFQAFMPLRKARRNTIGILYELANLT